MVRALGEGVGVELTYRGQGHGAYDSKNRCVRDAVNGYLLDGKVPPAGRSAPDRAAGPPLTARMSKTAGQTVIHRLLRPLPGPPTMA